MKLTASQERELLRIYRAPEMPPAETLGQSADRRGLEKVGALLWIGSGELVEGGVGPWELTAAGRRVARELEARAEKENA